MFTNRIANKICKRYIFIHNLGQNFLILECYLIHCCNQSLSGMYLCLYSELFFTYKLSQRMVIPNDVGIIICTIRNNNYIFLIPIFFVIAFAIFATINIKFLLRLTFKPRKRSIKILQMFHERKESNYYNSKRNNLTDVTNDDIQEISDHLRKAFHSYQNEK